MMIDEPLTVSTAGEVASAHRIQVKNVTLHRLPFVKDGRGNLTVGEFEREIPFIPKRYFLISDVPSSESRGGHAHRQCHQFLICLRGSCCVIVDDGKHREKVVLNRPNIGLYLPPLTWATQCDFTADAALMVFASHFYESDDYLRDYGRYLKTTE